MKPNIRLTKEGLGSYKAQVFGPESIFQSLISAWGSGFVP